MEKMPLVGTSAPTFGTPGTASRQGPREPLRARRAFFVSTAPTPREQGPAFPSACFGRSGVTPPLQSKHSLWLTW